ncbi:MAG: hypothetical protein M3O70_04635 [Actinomycetota bacterium]|nr:hypothetical protein [Actinomycetota bacterium]
MTATNGERTVDAYGHTPVVVAQWAAAASAADHDALVADIHQWSSAMASWPATRVRPAPALPKACCGTATSRTQHMGSQQDPRRLLSAAPPPSDRPKRYEGKTPRLRASTSG